MPAAAATGPSARRDFDASALIKLIFDESGSELAVELWDRAHLLVSGQLVNPEAHAALAAATRARRIDARTHERTSPLRIITIDEPLARRAGDIAAEPALRGYDAVHLACALYLQGDDVLLATWDSALNAAARASGQLIANGAG